MLLIAFIKDPLKCFRNSATYLVGNLAISDLTFSVAHFASIDKESRNFTVGFLLHFSFYSSMLTIFSIALDRCLMIIYPFKHRILMSKSKMVVWIGFVWLICCIHPLAKIFIKSSSDKMIRSGIGFMLIILTAVLCAKAYYVLRKQALSLSGIRNTSQSANPSIYLTAVKSESDIENNNISNETPSIECFADVISIDQVNHFSRSESRRPQINGKERVQNNNERAENEKDRAQNQNERAEKGNERFEIRNKLDETVENQKSEEQKEHIQIDDEQENRSAQSELSPNINLNSDKSTVNLSQTYSIPKQISSENQSTKGSRNSQAAHNRREQVFLNTIILIACIAVITVTPGSIYQVSGTAKWDDTIFHAVVVAMYSLNFAVNPFVYLLRLERYRRTFKSVYCCQH